MTQQDWKDDKIQELKEAREKAESKIKELEQTVSQVKQESNTKIQELSDKSGGHPEPAGAVKVWESCPDCKPKWDELQQQIREQAVNNLSQDDVRRLMKQFKIDEAPEKITVTGLPGRRNK